MADRGERQAEVANQQSALAGSWAVLKPMLEARRAELIVQLVARNDEGLRGRIQELDRLLGLPEALQQEAVSLQHPQEEDGFTG